MTPETGASLTATLSGNVVSGQYEEVYGSGAEAVTLSYRFRARLASQ